MSILDNELVRKYFCFFGEGVTMAERVLAAMEEPIRKGDKYLTIHHGLGVEEVANLDGSILQPFHPLYLRLPDRFQVAEEKCDHKATIAVFRKVFRTNASFCAFCGAGLTQPVPTPEKCGCEVNHMMYGFEPGPLD